MEKTISGIQKITSTSIQWLLFLVQITRSIMTEIFVNPAVALIMLSSCQQKLFLSLLLWLNHLGSNFYLLFFKNISDKYGLLLNNKEIFWMK